MKGDMWHYDAKGRPAGPISQTHMVHLISDGTVTPTTLVWSPGLSDWISASETELDEVFENHGPEAYRRREAAQEAQKAAQKEAQRLNRAGPRPPSLYPHYSKNKTEPEPEPAVAEKNWTRPPPARTEVLRIEKIKSAGRPDDSAYEQNVPSVVSLSGSQVQGSGFIISQDGLALTNHHVVSGQTRLVASFRDGRSLAARTLRSNAVADIALIQIAEDGDVVASTIDLSHTAEVGDDIVIIGTPLSEEFNFTLTKGVVSGFRFLDVVTMLQTDAAMNPGNSGGPIIDVTSGNVVGVVSMKLRGEALEGLGFGVDIGDALRAVGVRFKRKATESHPE